MSWANQAHINHCRWIKLSSLSILSRLPSNLRSISTLCMSFSPGYVVFPLPFLAYHTSPFHSSASHQCLFSLCYINSCSVSNRFKSSSSPTVLFGLFLYSCAARICVPGRISIPSINRLLVSSPPPICLILSLNLYTTLPLSHQNVSCCLLFSQDISCQIVVWRLHALQQSFALLFSSAPPNPAIRTPSYHPFSSNPCPAIITFKNSNICLISATSLTKHSTSQHPLQVNAKLPPCLCPSLVTSRAVVLYPATTCSTYQMPAGYPRRLPLQGDIPH